MPSVLLSLPARAGELFPRLASAAPAQESPSPTEPDCADDDEFCRMLWELTGQDWLAAGGYYILVKPFRIVVIVLAALILRYLLHRMIGRLTRRASEDGRPSLLRPLRQRFPSALQEATGLRTERRRQRAEALGSVLRSVTSVTIFTVAVMLILGELGVQLAPLIASAGIAGIALGFGAQNLVKDYLAGLSMLLEDQYGVGDVIDVGEASGTVEAVGLRITTLRDGRGVLWYIRNGEIVRVGNKSQGWALVVVDVPVGFSGVEEATAILRRAAADMAEDPDVSAGLIEPPDVLGVEQITADGAILRTTARTTPQSQWKIGRELRRRLTQAIEAAGITAHIAASRVFIRPPGAGAEEGGAGAAPPDPGTGGPT